MALPDVREKLIQKIDRLTDEQVAQVLRYAEALESAEPKADYDEAKDPSIGFIRHYRDVMSSDSLPDDYDAENDPMVGFFSSSPDLGSRTKDILNDEFGLKHADNHDPA